MNHSLLLIQNLYLSTSGKYRKFKVRFDNAIQSGRFYKLTKRKQSALVSRLKKLYQRLKSLQTQLHLAGAGAALALTLSFNNTAQAQNSLGPFERNDGNNPLPPPFWFYIPKPAPVDIDDDGDLDIFVGDQYGSIHFFRNDGGKNVVRRSTEITGTGNPLGGINKGQRAAPAFADMDGDGDFDMLLGSRYGETFFFRNTGSASNPVFTEQTGSNNPFDGVRGTSSYFGNNYSSAPVFVDFDGDTDVDLFIGSTYISGYGIPSIKYYENSGGVFTEQTGLNNPFRNGNYISEVPTFADLDNDGDLDALVGARYGIVSCWLNIGGEFIENTSQHLPLDPVNNIGNPLYNVLGVAPDGTPVFVDMDADNDLDLLVGHGYKYNGNGQVKYFENTGGYTFIARNDLNINPFGGVDVSAEAAPTFVDIDNDSDLDAIIGSKYPGTELSVYINNNGEFVASPTHPITGLNVTIDNIPVFVDIDNDGDQDLFVCNDYQIRFFRNNAGEFISETSPIAPVSVNEISLAFIDVDNDGDFDAFTGYYFGSYESSLIGYYENQGTATAPNFVVKPTPAPFNNLNFNVFHANPNLSTVDLDNDSDIDLVISETYFYVDFYFSRVRFFENNGNGTFTEAATPLIADQSPRYAFTSFADIDGDGDLDGFMGNGRDISDYENGRITYYENTNPPPVTDVNTATLNISSGNPVVIDATLTISDSDNDAIVQATVRISDFIAGEEELNYDEAFASANGIMGDWDINGQLIFTGKASINTYQTLLRTVTYNFTGTVPGGRRSDAGKTQNITRTISFEVFDIDFTSPLISTRNIELSAPAPNQPPVITPNLLTATGSIVTLNVLTIISDPDANFTPVAGSVSIVQQPTSGAVASLIFVSASVINIEVDYTDISFTGIDQLQIEACDDLGACTISTITIQVDVSSEIIVYNAISPNKGDLVNPFFKIEYIESVSPTNKVTIYNRWGDIVFEVSNYDNSLADKRFEGTSDNGKDLPSGIYFYKIEITNQTLTGYLSLKR